MARVRDLLQVFSSVFVCFTLVSASTFGASTVGVGTVVSADRAHVGNAAASVGTTVFNGDSLDTETLGNLQVRAGAARLLLSASSRVTWGSEENTPAATLKVGTATFSTANSRAFALRVATAVIRPKGEEPTVGSVTVLNPKELTIHCSRGALALTVIDDTLLVPEGTSYHVVLDPDANLMSDDAKAWPSNQQPRRSGRNRFIFFLIFAAAAATAVGLGFVLESPDRP
jgi:hypothetical protein